MEDDQLIHELCAGYALDALDPDDERRFEAHLAGCSSCQEELARMSATAASLAHAVPPAEPSDGLRSRIVEAARAERPNVTPLRRRRTTVVAGIAVAASVAAVVLGTWAVILHGQVSSNENAVRALHLRGAGGSLVVTHRGDATLIVSGLAPPPAGKTYQAWVVRNGKAESAGLFDAGRGTTIVRLTRRVPNDASVAVTLEPSGGSPQPTAQPVVTTPTVS
jgi:anti-sigma-K factor RskA